MGIRIACVAILLVSIAILGDTRGLRSASGTKSQPQSRKFVPFTAQIVVQGFDNRAATKPSVVTRVSYGRRGDGSDVTLTSVHSPLGESGLLGEIVDVASGKQIELDSFTKSRMTFYLSGTEVEDILDSNGCPANVNQLTERSRWLGYEVVRYRDVDKDSYEDDDSWLAPSLACFTMKSVEIDTRFGSCNKRTVLSLTPGEPPASMFSVPSEYVERSPAELAARWIAMFPGSPWLPADSLERVQRQYSSGRPGSK